MTAHGLWLRAASELDKSQRRTVQGFIQPEVSTEPPSQCPRGPSHWDP